MSDEDRTLKQEAAGIGLEYDPNRHVLQIILVFPDGTEKTIQQSREQALALYQGLGTMLAPYLDS